MSSGEEQGALQDVDENVNTRARICLRRTWNEPLPAHRYTPTAFACRILWNSPERCSDISYEGDELRGQPDRPNCARRHRGSLCSASTARLRCGSELSSRARRCDGAEQNDLHHPVRG